MALATLSIDLVAKLAELQAGMDKAVRIAEKDAARIERAFGGLTRVAVGIGAAFGAAISASQITTFIKATVDGVDRLNDLSDATGSTVENISALEDIAARTGTSIDTVGDAMLKFNKVLLEAKPGSEAANILKKLGLDAEELKRIDPAEALKKTADALAAFPNDGNLARVFEQLFGKGSREIAPFLKDLAEAGKLNATVTTEQAKAAEAFNQELFKLQKNVLDGARAITSSLVPALNKLFADLKAGGVSGASGLDGTTGKLGQLYDVYKLLSIFVQRQGPLDILKVDPTNKEALWNLERLDAEARSIAASATAARAAMLKIDDKAGRRPANEGGGRLRGITPSIGTITDSKEVDKAAREYEKLAASIGLVTTAASEEVAGGEKLTELQRARIKIVAALNDREVQFTAEQRRSLQAIADSLPVLDEQLQLHRLQADVRAHSLKLTGQESAALDRESGARTESLNALREQLEEYGKSADAIERLRIGRMEAAASEEALTIIGLRNIEGTEGETAAREELLRKLREEIALRKTLVDKGQFDRSSPTAGAEQALKDYIQVAEEAGIATRGAVSQGLSTLEDDATRSLASGKASVKNFVDFALQEIIRLQVVRPLLASVFGGAGSRGFSSLFNGGGLGGFQAAFSGTSLGSSGLGTGLAYGNQDFGGFFANGGFLGAGKWGIAGEKGPEPIIGPAQVVPNKGRRGVTNNYVVNVAGDASENTISLIQGAMAQMRAEQGGN